MEAIILAGGLGIRLRSAVPDLPKPMAPVKGKPFLGYLMDYWINEGVDRIILSVGYKHAVFQSHFGSRYKGIELSYAIEKWPLGTGGGLVHAAKKLSSQSPFLVLNGDTFFAVKQDALTEAHENSSADMTMSLVKVNEDSRYSGVQLDDDGFVRLVDARSAPSADTLVNGGVYLMERALLRDYDEQPPKKISLEDDIFPALIQQNKRILGFVSQAAFIDIGVPRDYDRAADLLSSFNNS